MGKWNPVLNLKLAAIGQFETIRLIAHDGLVFDTKLTYAQIGRGTKQGHGP
jgi:hypothetical protein